MFAETLRANGFDVVNGLGGNADSFDYDVSVVVTRKPNSRNKSVLVAESLGITRILEQYSDNQFIMEDVLVILGRDWDTLLTPKEENAD